MCNDYIPTVQPTHSMYSLTIHRYYSHQDFPSSKAPPPSPSTRLARCTAIITHFVGLNSFWCIPWGNLASVVSAFFSPVLLRVSLRAPSEHVPISCAEKSSSRRNFCIFIYLFFVCLFFFKCRGERRKYKTHSKKKTHDSDKINDL